MEIFMDFSESITVINAGYPGDNSRQLLERFEKDVAAHQPECVVLMCGTNDLLNSHNLVPQEEYRKNLAELAAKVRTIGAKLILCGTPDANETLMIPRHKSGFFAECSAARRVADANKISRELAVRENIPYIDVCTLLGKSLSAGETLFRNVENSGAPDGVHPTPEGYAVLADAVFAEISQFKPVPRKIVCFGDSITYGVYVKGEGSADPDAGNYPGRLARLLNLKG